jgi:hypothetical protein
MVGWANAANLLTNPGFEDGGGAFPNSKGQFDEQELYY